MKDQPATFNKTIREAASVVVLRDGVDGPEVFMLQRPGRGDFPDLHVFPGGKVDVDDIELGAQLAAPQSPNHPTQKFKAAALRECFEECGVLFADNESNPLSTQALQQFRADVLSKRITFKDGFERFELTFHDDAVLYFSHWITPPYAPARFDTRFFVAHVPAEQEAENHASETIAGSWQTPEIALNKYAKGDWQLIVPTITTLRMIAGYDNVNTLMDAVRHGEHRIPVTSSLHEKGMQYFVGTWCLF